MQRCILVAASLFLGLLHCYGQVNVTSPAASEFVRYERIPVSYFNGLPNIEIPLYTVDVKDLHLPISLSYHASGIKVNQYPTFVGLGWNLNAGGAIVRAINGQPDETCKKDMTDKSGIVLGGEYEPGYYYSSKYMDKDNWSSEESLIMYHRSLFSELDYDTEPDEFIINAYGVNGSVYFYRDKKGIVCSKIKSNNGETFKVLPPVMRRNTQEGVEIPFRASEAGYDLNAYRVYSMFYEFTVIKNDGTQLIFGGDDNCIEYYTIKDAETYPSSSQPEFLKTRPSAWMLRKVISPKGNVMEFTYSRDGSPVYMNNVITDVWVSEVDGDMVIWPSQDGNRGKSFVVQHLLYPSAIMVDNDLKIVFEKSRNNGMTTVPQEDISYLDRTGFSNRISDNVCYKPGQSTERLNFATHDYSHRVSSMKVYSGYNELVSYDFEYVDSRDERLKLKRVNVRDGRKLEKHAYDFRYNPMKLPSYTSTLADNWGYYNNKNYRNLLFTYDNSYYVNYRSSVKEFAEAESLTEIIYPEGGSISLEYELHDHSKVATQIPDFDLLKQDGKAGGLRIKEITYRTDTSSIRHSFEYKNTDGSSSGILSGIPKYVATGKQHSKLYFSDWVGLSHIKVNIDINQKYDMYSEVYINTLGSTSGNHVTYSRVIEKIGGTDPLIKEYCYSNHDTQPDTADFAMYTNMDDISLDNKFTSRAVSRGLLLSETWYSRQVPVKEVRNRYNTRQMNDYVKSIERFALTGLLPYNVPSFIRYTPYKILTFYPYLESRTETSYGTDGKSIISSRRETFGYNGNLLPEFRTSTDSKGIIETTRYTYPSDYSSGIFEEMQAANIIDRPVETVVYRKGKVISASLDTYAEFSGNILPSGQYLLDIKESIDSTGFAEYDGASADHRYRLDTEFLSYDKYGNPTGIQLSDGQKVSYQWGYSGKYPVAIVRNADHFFYNGFEDSDAETTFPLGFNSGKGNIPTYTIARPVESDLEYTVDYRTYRDNRWQYKRDTLSSSKYIIDEKTSPIDEIRLFPAGSEIETFTWYPYIGLRSRTDSRGVTETYSYDSFNRLQTINDTHGNIVRQYRYNYANGETEEDTGVKQTFYSEYMYMKFYSSKCNTQEYEFPTAVTYIVPYGKYTSDISQFDADIKAFNELMSNGQENADKNGSCVSSVILYVYNSTPYTVSLLFPYGPNGNISTLEFIIPPGVRTANTGNIKDDFEPVSVYLPRRWYRDKVAYGDDGTTLKVYSESGTTVYDKDYYPDYEDSYIIEKF